MPKEEKMTLDERRKYLKIQQRRYKKDKRKERTNLLSEMEETTGLHRKSLIRLMKSDLKRKVRIKQRGTTYGAEVDDALRVIAESFDYICAERMTPNLMKMARQLAVHGELVLSEPLEKQLEQISVSTVKRRVKRIRQDEPRLPRKKPSTRNNTAREVPMKRIAWDEQEPGHFEVDLVHHSGPTTNGQYMHTLQMIDVATGWSERVAILGRSNLVMEDGFRRILARLPFAVLEFHPDNGSEFINRPLLRFWKEAVPCVELSRSHPFKKNDNRFVEQKNDSLVRAYFGNDRFDTVDQCLLMNRIYNSMWLYYNFYQPVLRLKAKEIVVGDDHTRRVKRIFDTPQTPFDRLCATNILQPELQAELEQLRDQTNPRQLRKEIYVLLDQLLCLPCAVPGKSEPVRATLLASNPQSLHNLSCGKVERNCTSHFPTAPTTTAAISVFIQTAEPA